MNLKIIASLFLLCSFFGCASPSATDDKEISADVLIKKIKKGENLLYDGVTITGDFDITKIVAGYPESKGVIRYDLFSSFAFINCTFQGKIIGYRNDGSFSHVIRCYKNLAFIGCEFQDEVIFKEAVIDGAVNFGNSKFNKEAIFTGATFNFRYNYFNESLFKDKVYFQGLLCRGSLNFMKAEFLNIAYFQNAEFEDIAQFSNSRFYQNADFSLVSFKGGCMFNYVQFNGKAIFSSSLINKRGDYIEVAFKGPANFRKARIDGELKFTRSVFSGGLNLDETVFVIIPPEILDVTLENESKIESENAKIIERKELNLK